MNIDTSKLPMTLDEIRQEIIKKEGDRVIDNYKDNANGVAMSFCVLAFCMLLAQHPNHMNKIIFVIQLILIFVALIIFSYTIMGRLQQYYHRKLAPTNYGLSKDDINNKVFDYMQDKKRTMNNELVDLDKQKQLYVQKYDTTSKAYYKIYLAYTKLTVELRPEYYSSMEGGDPSHSYIKK